MAAPKGNQYYKSRKKDGKDKLITPGELFEKALEYMQWLKDNPLKETKVFASMGELLTTCVDHVRIPLEDDFFEFAGIKKATFHNYAKNEDYLDVVMRIRALFKTKRIQSASAGFANANLIARIDGLSEKTDINVKSESDDVKSKFPFAAPTEPDDKNP